jgi:hypothetical protein
MHVIDLVMCQSPARVKQRHGFLEQAQGSSSRSKGETECRYDDKEAYPPHVVQCDGVVKTRSSAHVTPSEEYPGLHTHIKEPLVLLHVSFMLQALTTEPPDSVPSLHSSTSAQDIPEPLNPMLHVHV